MQNTQSATRMADRFVAENAEKIEKIYRHTYHVMPPIGWMNDPNGFHYAFGKYHLFYQYYPYSPYGGAKHWGHYTSDDFVKWEVQPTALAPDADYDREGCYSGSSIVKDGKLHLMYTSVHDGNQTQALAYSDDGIRFIKVGEVISGEQLPKDFSRTDFRDPKVFERDGKYYAIIGSKAGDGSGQLLLFKSADLYQWEYVGIVRRDKLTLGGIYECPDFAQIDKADVLISSPQFYANREWRYENVQSAVYMTGRLNPLTGAFEGAYEDEIDGGFDFYAPQTLQAPDGRTIMIAWMQMWFRSMPTVNHGWAGAMTLPRELTLKNGKLCQRPVREIEKYRRNMVAVSDVAIGNHTVIEGVSGGKVELKFTLDLGAASVVGVKLFQGKKNAPRVYYDRARDLVVFDRSDMGMKIGCHERERDASVRSVRIAIVDNRIEMHIFLDVSCCEIFLNGGERTMTGNVYSRADDTGIAFYADGNGARIVSLEKYDIVV